MGKPGDGIIYLSDIGEHRQTGKYSIVLVLLVAKKYEGHRGQKAVTVLKLRAFTAKERDVIIRRGKLEAEAEKLKEIKLKKEKEKKVKAEAAEKKKSDASSHKSTKS